ncbi:hypothetical protein ACTOWA_00530 [Herbaspirillum seropedicae]|uniref:hypothetical protein n=1 Tax=Herbaspirillum seropedicae TaxID=964 RepID=UPI00285511A1|nr:hypothetical protein [Herbaspirillum seropedicae]MDR6397921.1 hypothetical protein [Herbaspirillum seropedicae]
MTKNEHGVVQYPKADARRLFVLLAAIDYLERPTLTSLSEFTGHNKGTIDADVAKLREQYGVMVEKDGPVYSVESWGDLLKKSAVKKFLQG